MGHTGTSVALSGTLRPLRVTLGASISIRRLRIVVSHSETPGSLRATQVLKGLIWCLVFIRGQFSVSRSPGAYSAAMKHKFSYHMTKMMKRAVATKWKNYVDWYWSKTYGDDPEKLGRSRRSYIFGSRILPKKIYHTLDYVYTYCILSFCQNFFLLFLYKPKKSQRKILKWS
jgi:hypothetical protein